MEVFHSRLILYSAVRLEDSGMRANQLLSQMKELNEVAE
jgi:hypothetical protein